MLAIVARGLLIVFWALVAAPRATNRLAQRTRLVAGSGALLVAAVLLLAAGEVVAATVLAVAIAVNTVLLLGDGV